MKKSIELKKIIDAGLSIEDSNHLCNFINQQLISHAPDRVWDIVSKELFQKKYPFNIHLLVFSSLFPDWPDQLDSAPAVIPNQENIKKTNIAKWMAELNIENYKNFHEWSYTSYQTFWESIIKKLYLQFDTKPSQICDLSLGIESPRWLVGAKFNIAKNCFNANPEKNALIYMDHHHQLKTQTYKELNKLSDQIAYNLQKLGLKPYDAIAIDMPMTAEAVAIYLGIIKMGGIVVSIADSFSSEEIAIRLEIAKTKLIFTQDFILRDGKKIALYEKIIAANAPNAIVLPANENIEICLRKQDLKWDEFLINFAGSFSAYSADAIMPCNILFSSGTTGTPKAIPWYHTTPIKSASDAYLHHDVQKDDIITWPTSLGWMMGPWVIFAALLNQATLALYHDVPNKQEFGQFIQDAKVTILGVVPALIANWRRSRCMENFDWQAIRLFSSSGECSNPEDMLYLMSLAGYKPIIEYCGGTETGGGYITSTMIEKNYPSLFTTPALGSHFVILDDDGLPASQGEVALIPPTLGLSTELLNANHHEIYFADMPKQMDGTVLRRHGDQIIRYKSGLYSVLGRVDDTMNLSGIKISSAEIERVLVGIPDIAETAAIAVSPKHHGPSQLVIYAVTKECLTKESIKKQMQDCINAHLNPLFKIHDVVFITEMPKTASNKTMRRILRDQYLR